MPDTQIIAPRVPLIDPRTNLISREWYRYFLNLLVDTSNNAVDINALLTTPPAANNPIYAELLNIIGQVQNMDQVSSELAVLSRRIQDLEAQGSDQVISALAALQNEIQSLAVSPPSLEVQSLTFGSFTRSTGATATAINTPQTVSFESQDLARGGIAWTAGTPTRIYVYTPGTYNFQFSAQATKSSASLGYMWIWPAISGTDVPNSSGRVSFQGSNSDLIAAWNWFLTMNAGDYFELKWAVNDLNTVLIQDAAPAFGPTIPAVILTANRVSL
jgi:hypothetical protein